MLRERGLAHVWTVLLSYQGGKTFLRLPNLIKNRLWCSEMATLRLKNFLSKLTAVFKYTVCYETTTVK